MKRLLLSCFGLGWLPIAPGTWGSLPPAIIFGLMFLCGASVKTISVVMIVLALAGSVICVKLAAISIAATGKTDPKEVVVDEFAGQAIVFLTLAVGASFTIQNANAWAITLPGFLLFRFFDIVKPWPIHKLEKFPQGWGILMDDILAGIYAGITLVICARLWVH